jgi:6,7-dimethyl-8-ribityllumazine synthase
MGRIAFIQSSWHSDIVDQARLGFLRRMTELGWTETEIDLYRLPGAFEIPLHAQKLAKTGRYDGIVAAGLVVDGGIYRHEFVAETVVSGLMRVQLDTGVPVFSAVLTPHHFHDGGEHPKFFHAHFDIKGVEVANACAATLTSLKAIAAL